MMGCHAQLGASLVLLFFPSFLHGAFGAQAAQAYFYACGFARRFVTEPLALGTAAILWRFKKLPEPVVVLVAAFAGLALYPLMMNK
jgi:chromate transporter